MSRAICIACGTQYPDAETPPRECPICLDPRQYVPVAGQRWTTMDELAADHRNEVRDDHGFTGIGTTPHFAIGQRALLVPWEGSNLLWDSITLLDDATAAEVDRRGGLRAIAISHPHFYAGMVEWAHRFGCPILLHAADERWIMRRDDAVELWDGDSRDLGDGLTLVRGGGHFPGGAMLHVARGAGRLLSGDIIHVIPDRAHVAFMWSYPNLVPLPEATVREVAASVAPFPFASIHGAWWDAVVSGDGNTVVARSAERYGRALRGEL